MSHKTGALRRPGRRGILAPAAAVLSLAAVSGCSSSAPAGDAPDLTVTGAYVRQPPTDDMAAGYFVVHNDGGSDDALMGASSKTAKQVTLHRTTKKDQMKRVPTFSVPAHGTLILESGGNHLMLMGMQKKPRVGDTVTFRLRFAHAGTITVKAPVKPMTYQPADH